MANAISKPVILIESETLDEEEDDEDVDDEAARGGMEVDANSDDAAFSTALMNRHRLGRDGVASETDDDEDELEDPDDWTRMDAGEADECQTILDDVRRNFEDDVDLFDTTMVAEYAEDIFAYMEELEVRLLDHIPSERLDPPTDDQARPLPYATAQDDAQPALHGIADRDRVVDANDARRLAASGPPALPHAA
jgi:hypothetical protein